MEVIFVDKCDRVLLKYVEKVDRSLDEMQEYEQKLESYRVKRKSRNE